MLLPETATPRDRKRALIRFCTRTTSCTTIACVRPSSRSALDSPASLNTVRSIAPVRRRSASAKASLWSSFWPRLSGTLVTTISFA